MGPTTQMTSQASDVLIATMISIHWIVADETPSRRDGVSWLIGCLGLLFVHKFYVFVCRPIREEKLTTTRMPWASEDWSHFRVIDPVSALSRGSNCTKTELRKVMWVLDKTSSSYYANTERWWCWHLTGRVDGCRMRLPHLTQKFVFVPQKAQKYTYVHRYDAYLDTSAAGTHGTSHWGSGTTRSWIWVYDFCSLSLPLSHTLWPAFCHAANKRRLSFINHSSVANCTAGADTEWKLSSRPYLRKTTF